MKVAYVSDWNPRYNSGVGTVISGCIQAGPTHGWESVLVGPSFQGCELHRGVWLPSIGVGRGYRIVLTALPEVYGELARVFLEADLVHLHSISPATVKSLQLLSKMPNRPPVILHLHTQAGAYLARWLGRFAKPVIAANEKLTNWCCKQADLVLSPTDFFAEIAWKTYHLERKPKIWSAPIRLPEPLPAVSWHELLSRSNTRLPDNAKILYFIGRIAPEKNIEFLIEVMKLTGDESICLVLSGGGDIQKYRNKLPETLRKRVGFLGHLNQAEALSFCKYAWIGITASVTEVQGLGLLEQMAMGLPVLAPMHTCFDQPILDSRGGEILPLDPAIWAKMIREMMTDPYNLYLIGQMGRKHIGLYYSSGQYDRLSRIYSGLLSARLLSGLAP